jgi:hypothetical protein
MKEIIGYDWGNPQPKTPSDPLTSSNWKIWGGILLSIIGGIITTFVSVGTIRKRSS